MWGLVSIGVDCGKSDVKLTSDEDETVIDSTSGNPVLLIPGEVVCNVSVEVC